MLCSPRLQLLTGIPTRRWQKNSQRCRLKLFDPTHIYLRKRHPNLPVLAVAVALVEEGMSMFENTGKPDLISVVKPYPPYVSHK